MPTSRIIATAVALALASMVSLTGCTSGGDDPAASTAPGASSSTATSATTPSSRVTESDLHTYVGSPTAPVTVTVYEDFLCPWCKEYHDVSTQALEPLVDQGQVRLDYRPFNHLARLGSYSGDATAVFAAVGAIDHQASIDFRQSLYDHQPTEEGPVPTLSELKAQGAATMSARTGMTAGDASDAIDGFLRGSYVQDWVSRATNTAYNQEHVEYTPWVTVTAADGRPMNVEFGDDDTTEQFVQSIVDLVSA